MNVNVFNTNEIEDTIRRRDRHFTWSSELRERQAASGQRQYSYFSATLRNWVLVRPRESNPRPPALQSSALPTELQSRDSCRGKEIVISVILSLNFTFSEIKIFHNLDQWCSSDFLLSASSPSVLSHLPLNFLWEYPISLKGYPFLVYQWLAGTQKQRCPLLYFFLCWDRLVFTRLSTSQAFTEHLLCANNAYQFYTYLISS